MIETERLTRDGLLATFESYGKPRRLWRVGGEFERAVVRHDGSPVPYDGPDGIRWILEQLEARQADWTVQSEDGHPIALVRPDMSSITLEPGGQVELSGAPHDSLAGLAAEMHDNREALLSLAEGKDLRWIASGLTPVAAIEDIPWMPKGRYKIMREYLGKTGDLAHFMMKGTCSVQANYDFLDEADCAAKVRLASGLAPLTTAIFANSPLYKGKPNGFKTYRGHIWTRTDPDRTGFPPGLRADYTHARWVDYLLDVPMMFYRRHGEWTAAHGATFRTFMDKGLDGCFPTESDWSLHQTSVFPEVRIKHTIEVRGADCVDHELALAFCALFTGLLYCRNAMDEALALVAEIEKYGTRDARFDAACHQGLEGMVGGRSLAEWASDLGDIADRGIQRCLPKDAPLVQPLLERIDAGRCPADDVLDAWARDPSPEALVRAVAY
jgi:glutamate--cysteine ligase